jgi:hypothetical protein
VIFKRLDTLEDAGGIRILRSKHQIRRVGDQLHNCVGSENFGHRAEMGSILLAVVDDPRERPVALGLYILSESHDNLGRYRNHQAMSGWHEVKGASNTLPPREVLEQFDAYLPRLKSWHASQLSEDSQF